MSSPPSSSSSGSYKKKLILKAIDGIHGLSDGYIEGHQRNSHGVEPSKRVTMAALMSGLSEIGMENLTQDDSIHENDEQYAPLPLGQTRKHFTDKLISKVVNKITAAQEGDKLRTRLDDARRAQQPKLSVTQLVLNFRSLSYKMNNFFDFEKKISSILLWDSSWKTLFYLLLYTWGCIYPYMFLLYPLVMICGAVLIPNYLDRHPLDKPEIISERPRGAQNWLFGFLSVSKSEMESYNEEERLSQLREELFERQLREHGYYGLNDSTPMSSAPSSDTEDLVINSGAIYGTIADAKTKLIVQGLVSNENAEKNGSTKDNTDDTGTHSKFVDNLSLVISMRDLQNLTTRLLELMSNFENTLQKHCSFQDEKRSTIVFLEMTLLMAVTCLFGPYIPWKLIFVLVGWVIVLSCHPKRAEFMNQFKSEEKVKEERYSSGSKDVKRISHDIIIDEPIKRRSVAIFEIQQQDISRPSVYRPFAYSRSCFTVSSSRRVERKKPRGTDSLEMVKPPSKRWKFDPNGKWEVDLDTEAWCSDMNIMKEVHVSVDEGWACDLNGEYRRRRLFREVYLV
ncbi:hypothetical protein FOA43_001431 [Brettanomyces nanus]|uniref:TECPR1-like DysF domain-containing protein n=1 Tax=Eeniella nana TaxID=13502 RepID=A0A875S2Q9_EENNA|nr:uncharacterized protein FOA43_001431 [Brettanomyces nanus]QPG74109.1 hypothetical protein FOA43_001431 [Brettanomyces nanus]